MKIKTILVLIAFTFLLFGCTQSTTQMDDKNNKVEEKKDMVENKKNDDSSLVDMNKVEEKIVDNNLAPVENNTNVFSSFKSLMTGLPEWEITYTITSAGVSINTTQYLKNDKLRADTTAEGTESRVYALSSGQFVCSKINSAWTCYDMTQQTGEAINSGFDEARANPDKYSKNITSAGTKTVLGQMTDCFNIKDTDYDYVYCLNKKGAPLYMEGTVSKNKFTYVATSYKDSVADSVFELPAKPGAFEMPSIPGYN